jgi:hypothetical protein
VELSRAILRHHAPAKTARNGRASQHGGTDGARANSDGATP